MMKTKFLFMAGPCSFYAPSQWHSVFLSLATTSFAAGPAQKELHQYPYWIGTECKKLTFCRDRKAQCNNYYAALQCAKNTVECLEEQRLRDSEIELNEAKI